LISDKHYMHVVFYAVLTFATQLYKRSLRFCGCV